MVFCLQSMVGQLWFGHTGSLSGLENPCIMAMLTARLLLPGKGKQFVPDSLGRFWCQDKMEPEAHGTWWGCGGIMLPVLRGAGESSGQLEVIVQSNVSMFKLSVYSGMEGDYWFWFFPCLSQ